MGTLTYRIKNLAKDKGFVICFVLSIVVLIVFFHNLLFHANFVYFGTSGDGIQIYFTSWYHALYDETYLYQDLMNYPYKESVFFTGCQPVLTNLIKLFSLQDYTIGIINLTMLLSMPVSACFLYFIFKEFKVNYLFAALAAVLIAYLSPQIFRMGAHYTLAYMFAIPLIIWLMIKFYNSPNFLKTTVISISVFLMASTHMYFLLFYGIIISFVWIVIFLTKNFREALKLFLKHYFIQLILPFVILQVLIFSFNDFNDRTEHPWGFYEYISNWSGVFYPFGKYYEYLFKNNNLENISVSGEGVAFVGLCATVLTLIFALKVLRNILNLEFGKIFKFTNHSILNGLIVCGFISLFYSFAWPFIFGYQNLVYHLGFIQQMRALGRFAWIFFYIINIALVVFLSELSPKWNKFFLKQVLIVLFLFILSYDSYMNIVNCNDQYNNKIVELNDTQNVTDENLWLKKINVSEFQCILALPYYHIGSENVGLEPTGSIQLYSFIASLKTGLPLIPVVSCRISLDQTYKNLSLVKEPNGRVPQVLNEFKNKKDILVISQNDIIISESERQLLAISTPVIKTIKFDVRKITYNDFVNYYKNYTSNKVKLTQSVCSYKNPVGYLSNDSLNNYIFKTFEEDPSAIDGHGTKGIISGDPANYFTVFNDSLVDNKDSICTVSFWFKDFNKDLYPRATIAVDASNNNELYNLHYCSLKDRFVQLDGSWALIECKFKLKSPTDRVKVVLWTQELLNGEKFEADDVLLKPEKTKVFKEFDHYYLINNYIYYKE